MKIGHDKFNKLLHQTHATAYPRVRESNHWCTVSATDHAGMGSVAPTTTSGPFDLKAAYIQNLGIYFRLRISGNHISAAVTQVEIVGHETVTEAGDLFSYAYDAGDDYTEWQFNISGAYWDGAGTSDINVTFA